MLGAVEALTDLLGTALVPALRPWHGALVTAARARLGEDDLRRAWAEGRRMGPEEALAYALELEGPVGPSG